MTDLRFRMSTSDISPEVSENNTIEDTLKITEDVKQTTSPRCSEKSSRKKYSNRIYSEPSPPESLRHSHEDKPKYSAPITPLRPKHSPTTPTRRSKNTEDNSNSDEKAHMHISGNSSPKRKKVYTNNSHQDEILESAKVSNPHTVVLKEGRQNSEDPSVTTDLLTFTQTNGKAKEDPPPPKYLPSPPKSKGNEDLEKPKTPKLYSNPGIKFFRKNFENFFTSTLSPTATTNTTVSPVASPTTTPTSPKTNSRFSSKTKTSSPTFNIPTTTTTETTLPEKVTENVPAKETTGQKNNSNIGRFDFSTIPMPMERGEGGENKELYEQLTQFFLSPAAATEKEQKELEDIPVLEKDEIFEILRVNVEDIDNMLDRSGKTPISNFIFSTYQSGLPLFKKNTSVQSHIMYGLKIIFHKAPPLAPGIRKPMFQRLAEAYTACQMEQCRVIDSLYGLLTGRDLSFREQVLSLVDTQKEQVLNQVVNHYNPNAWKTSDENPRGQIPHIQSSYCIAIGYDFGLRGITAAKMDKNSFSVHPKNAKYLKDCFKRLFSVQELVNTIVNDINQQEEDADRLINVDSLTKWAGDSNTNNGFPSHSIYYDEDDKASWNPELGVPKRENIYKPFLNHLTALNILVHLFLKSTH